MVGELIVDSWKRESVCSIHQQNHNRREQKLRVIAHVCLDLFHDSSAVAFVAFFGMGGPSIGWRASERSTPRTFAGANNVNVSTAPLFNIPLVRRIRLACQGDRGSRDEFFLQLQRYRRAAASLSDTDAAGSVYAGHGSN